MTDVDNLPIEELRAALATEVMGWERRDDIPLRHPPYWFNNEGHPCPAVCDWQPDANWADHVTLFLRVRQLDFETQAGWSNAEADWTVRSGKAFVRELGQDYLLTFCLAALKAVRERSVTG